MNYKISLIKTAIKWTPNKMIIWVANILLKGIAELSDFNFDIDERKAHVQTTLCGETEMIEIWLADFAILKEDEGYKFILRQAKSNKPWLNNLFIHFTDKGWKIPALPQIAPYMELIAELFQDKSSTQPNTDAKKVF